MRAASFAAVAAVLLVGCGATPPAPPDIYYRLVLPGELSAATVPPIDGTVLVTRLSADGMLEDRAIAHAAARAPQELMHYNYHFWSDAPPKLLQTYAADYLRAAGVAGQVLLPEVGVDGTHELVGRVRRFEHLTGEQETVSVSLELGVVELRDETLVLLETYSASRPVSGDGFSDVVRALNVAVDEVFAQFLADLSRVR